MFRFFILLALCAHTADARSKPWNMRYRYSNDEPMSMYGLGMRSVLNPRIDYQITKSLPVVASTEGSEQSYNFSSRALGIVTDMHRHSFARLLYGSTLDRLATYPHFGKPVTCDYIGTLTKLDDAGAKRISRFIAQQYRLFFMLDKIVVRNKGARNWVHGIAMGDHSPSGPVLYNHLRFLVVHSPENQIVAVEADARSQRSCERPDELQHISSGSYIHYSYSIEFKEVSDHEATTFAHSLIDDHAETNVHPIMIVALILILFVAIGIFALSVYYPVSTTRSSDILESDDAVAAFNVLVTAGTQARIARMRWKALQLHVFKPPIHPTLLAAVTGIGAQLLSATFAIIFVGVCGTWSSYVVDSLETIIFGAAIASFLIAGAVAAIVLQFMELHMFRGTAPITAMSETKRLIDTRPPHSSSSGSESVGEAALSSQSESSSAGSHISRDSLSRRKRARAQFRDPERAATLIREYETVTYGSPMSAEELHALNTIGGKAMRALTGRVFQWSTLVALVLMWLLTVLSTTLLPTLIARWATRNDDEAVVAGLQGLGRMRPFWMVSTTTMLVFGFIAGRLWVPTGGARPVHNLEPDRTAGFNRLRFIALRYGAIVLIAIASFGGGTYGFYNSFWGSRVGAKFGYMMFNVSATCATVCLLAASFMFHGLHHGDEKWWWTSFHYGGAGSLAYTFMGLVYYFAGPITSRAATILYFSYLLMTTAACYVMLGSVSFIFCYFIVCYIYDTRHAE